MKSLVELCIPAQTAIRALQTGFARKLFYEIFAYLNGDQEPGPTVLRNPPVNSPYQRWLERAKKEIPVFEGLVLQDVEHVALLPWSQLGEGVTGLYLHFADYQMTDGRIVEIPARGKTVSQRHLYEIGVYILTGSGYTILQQEGKPQQRVEWKQGDLFSVPLNVLHQHCVTGDAPARMLMVTSFPLVLNVMNNEDFINDNPYAFTDRYDGSPDFRDRVENADQYEVTANFIEDIRTTAARRADFRGRGNKAVLWKMAGNSMLTMHIAEMPPRMYKRAHRHTNDSFFLLLSGEGFSVAWREGAYDERVRVDWKAGTLFVPPMYWYHQHLNSGSRPARYLAINVPRLVTNLGLNFLDQLEVDIPEVRREWGTELEKTSTEP